MTPAELRNKNYHDLRGELSGQRRAIFAAWLAHGPCRTDELAQQAQMNLLTVRPRTTDLYQMGLVKLVGTAGHHGIYQARTQGEWEQWKTEECPSPIGQQSLL